MTDPAEHRRQREGADQAGHQLVSLAPARSACRGRDASCLDRTILEHALEVVLAHCHTPQEQDAAEAALSFKCDVLWAVMDAIDHAYA